MRFPVIPPLDTHLNPYITKHTPGPYNPYRHHKDFYITKPHSYYTWPLYPHYNTTPYPR